MYVTTPPPLPPPPPIQPTLLPVQQPPPPPPPTIPSTALVQTPPIFSAINNTRQNFLFAHLFRGVRVFDIGFTMYVTPPPPPPPPPPAPTSGLTVAPPPPPPPPPIQPTLLPVQQPPPPPPPTIPSTALVQTPPIFSAINNTRQNFLFAHLFRGVRVFDIGFTMYVTPPPPPPPPPPIQPTLPPVQQPPPPPPPTIPSTALVQTAPIFSVPPPPITVPAIPVYDASRPPPSYGMHNQSRKRPADQAEAGPSKARKEEYQDENCELCEDRELRIDVYKKQLEKLQCQRLLYKMKLEEYENGKRLLRSIIVNPDIYRKLEEYIEGGPTLAERQYQEIFSMSGPSPEIRRNEGDNPSQRLDETIMQALNIPRRTARHSSPSDVQAVLELLRNANTPIERSPLSDPTPRLEPEPTPATNAFNRFHGQKPTNDNASTTSSTPKRHPNSGRTSRSFGSPVADPSGLSSSSSQASHSPAPSYPVYHPAILPPLNRPYYGPHYMPGTSGQPPPLHASNNSLPAPPTPQMHPTRPSTSAVPGMPPNGQNYNPYMMGRYPRPPNYYPPYQ